MKVFLLSTGYMHELRSMLTKAENDKSLFQGIVNAPFNTETKGRPLGLTIVVLLQVNKANNTLDRIALADTESAHGAMEFSVKKFEEIRIPLDAQENALIKAIRSNTPQTVTDWQYLFTPVLTPEEALFNQSGAGIATSIVYPLTSQDGGALIYSYVLDAGSITKQYQNFMQKYSKLVDKHLNAKRNGA